MLSSCESNGVSSLNSSNDTLTATVEGLALTHHGEAEAILMRGDTVSRTMTHNGYFQFTGIDFGLYILEVRENGHGGNRELVSIDNRHVIVSSISIPDYPWPIASINPQDSLVFPNNFRDSTIDISFVALMDHASVEAGLHSDPSMGIKTAWGASQGFDPIGETLRLTLSISTLNPGTRAKLTLAGSAQTRDGNRLDSLITIWIINKLDSTTQNPIGRVRGKNPFRPPHDTITFLFSEPMDLPTLLASVYTQPETPYQTYWDNVQNALSVFPKTRWPVSGMQTVGIRSGYRTGTGKLGNSLSEQFQVWGFGPKETLPPGTLSVDKEFFLDFDLAVDSLSLKFKIDAPVKAAVSMVAPSRIRFTFTGYTEVTPFKLEIQSLRSIYGDSLESPLILSLSVQPRKPTFQIRDSLRIANGISPLGDSVVLACTAADYLRMKGTKISISPFYPFTSQWSAAQDGSGLATLRFDQPIPTATNFLAYPSTGARPGDTAVFSSQALKPAIMPYFGANTVKPDEDIVLAWNTLIDTSGFVGHLLITPALDTLAVSQSISEGRTRTLIRHSAFSKGTPYTLRILGVTDLFSVAAPDTIHSIFKTAP